MTQRAVRRSVFAADVHVLADSWDNYRQDEIVAANLLLFTSTWAEAICAPYRAEVLRVAAELSCNVIELDIDLHPAEAQSYGVLNVPAVATAGRTEWPPIVGAQSAGELLAILRSQRRDD